VLRFAFNVFSPQELERRLAFKRASVCVYFSNKSSLGFFGAAQMGINFLYPVFE
jgi:hypothetical protein